MIRTIIVDDEILSRIGIRSFIDGKDNIQVTGIFGDAREAMEFLRENVTDIVITDIEMSDMSGLDLISVIRSENLAAGIIIVSSYDNFLYAQTAISKGTNSYLLKMDITEESLVREVLRVYDETVDKRTEKKKLGYLHEGPEEGTYVIGIPRVKNEADEKNIRHIDGSMFISLLEEVILRYQMGTVFSPSNRELFIIFRFDKTIPVKDLKYELKKNISAIIRNVQQYINGRVIFGISSPFTDLKDTHSRYDEAVSAADLDFYGFDTQIYECSENTFRILPFTFSADRFIERNGMDAFKAELHEICETARNHKKDVDLFKSRLVQSLDNMIWQSIRENRTEQDFSERWIDSSAAITETVREDSVLNMEISLTKLMKKFHDEMTEELEKDDLSKIFRYIEQHLDKKISLTELAEVGHMSIPSMSKKFKERADVTITQYINTERIKRVKILLKDPSNSLWQIAEITGFANVNYLIRVFKKITGMTIGEYRRSLGISTADEAEKDAGE